jgi:SulP family sulfate permease
VVKTARDIERRPSWIERLLPIVSWAPKYERAWLRPDLIAGLTVAALVIPKSLGYAGIARVPLQNGLYAAAAGAIVYALFATSRQISTGPSSALAAVAGSAVVATAVSGEAQATAIVATIAALTGVLFLALAVFRMGWISQFLSQAVITGFLFGAAIQVTVGELSKLTGTDSEGENSWKEFVSWLEGADEAHGLTLLIGIASLVVIVGLRLVAPRVPGALVLVVGGLAASLLFDLGDRGVALVGDVPRGLPALALPDLDLLREHAADIGTAAIALVLIGFSQTAGDARFFATKHRYRIEVNQEAAAQGFANVGASLVQGIPVSTSLSASSLNDGSGAKTQVSSLVSGALILLTLVVLAPLFSELPKPVLAAVIIEAVVFGMMDVAAMRRMWRVKRSDFWIALAALLGVLTFGVLPGVVIGVVLSVGWLVHVVTRPAMPTLGRERGTHVFRELDAFPNDETFPGVLVVRLDGGLYFVTAGALEDRIRELAVTAEPLPRALILDCKSVNFIDSQGSAQLGSLVDQSRRHGVTFRLARVKPAVLEVLGRDGVVERLGREHIHEDVNQAVEAESAARDPS